MILIGVTLTPVDFQSTYSKPEDLCKYLSKFDLDNFKYQSIRGMSVSEEEMALKDGLEKDTIMLSIHVPYLISLSTMNTTNQRKVIKYIVDTARIASTMGANRMVVQLGALLEISPRKGLSDACALLKSAIMALDFEGLGDIHICPETMSQVNSLGGSEEIITLCQVDERCIPTIGFDHLHCQSLGTLVTKEDWEQELQKYIDALGYERMKYFHGYFSKIEYIADEEKYCVTMEQEPCGPDYKVIISVLKKLKLEPRIVCEFIST